MLTELQKYLSSGIGDTVRYREDDWYSETTLKDAGLQLTYYGVGKYQFEEPRTIFVPYADISMVYEADGVIVAETGAGRYELRKALTEDEMNNGTEESPALSLEEILNF